MKRPMKISDTRYKGVWSGGHAAAMRDAATTLRDFVSAGGEFSSDSGSAWDRNTLALKLGGRIAVPDADAIILAMDFLMARNKADKKAAEG